MLEDRHVVRVGRAVRLMTRVAGLLTASVLAGGCSLLPFGGGAKHEQHALRPQLHEAKPNAQPDCIAEVTPTDVADIADDVADAPGVSEPAATADASDAPGQAPGCTTCACKPADTSATAKASIRPNAPPPALIEGSGAIGFVPATAPAAEEALQRLMDGNKRFVEGEAENVYRLAQRPGGDARRQRAPGAMVLACADWSIQPESAFDARAGELFVVRVVGNVADAAVVDSARYAVEQYDVPLIVVLGHEECAAAGAGRKGDLEVEAVEGRTAAHALDADGAPEGEPAAASEAVRAVHANVEEVVAHLRRADPVLSARIASGELKIVGACYDERNGQIALEPEMPPTEVTATPRE
jgi:carbonic anhydrase